MFTDFPRLQTLKLSNNNLEGSILSGANHELSVYNIYLDRNKFEGTLPSNLSGNTQILDLHDNKFSGQLSTSFWNLSYLLALSVASNSLTGEIDRSICKLTSIQVLDLSENNFSGCVPNCCNKLALQFLNMSKNSLSGIPHRLFNGSYIRALDIRYNQFTGNLDWIQFLSQVKLLMLGGNMFEGQISESICHLHHLNILDLSHNRFSGPLTPCIGGISLGSHANNIDPWSTGNTTDSVWYYDSMNDDAYPEEIYYNEYDLQGFTFSTKGSLYTYDRKFFNSMFGIDLSGNLLSGEIPWEIGNLSNAKSLNLSHNFFTGQIPATLANISAVESLDLSHNKLSGTIPSELTQLWSLEVFSVAYNNLSGCIPASGQFSTFSMESYKGNKNLQKMSPGNGCSAGSNPVAPAREHVGGALHDPVLSVVTAACFVLGFGATVVFSFCSSYGHSVMLKL
jgi:Leucine-rich repeat (LRR) protein